MKGIVLAGGSGTRLYPITKGVSKQLLPIYNTPMIYHPVSLLMKAGIKDILIISTPYDLNAYIRLLGDGSDLGINFSYLEQPSPDGLAQAFIIGEDFIGEDSVCLVLGDNILYGNNLDDVFNKCIINAKNNNKASIFGYYVKDPQRYGVVEFNENKEVLSISEKPNNPKSNYAVIGLYFYPNSVVNIAKNIKPSKRGELEITSVNDFYLKNKKLSLELFGTGYAWLDTGTYDSLSEAGEFVKALEKRQGLKIACLEEIAYKKKFITKKELNNLTKKFNSTEYGNYLSRLLNHENK